MYIDFNNWKGAELGMMETSRLQEESCLQLVAMLKPEFNQDGDQYCFTYPSRSGIPHDCVQGFGETPMKAVYDFNHNFYNQKTKVDNE